MKKLSRYLFKKRKVAFITRKSSNRLFVVNRGYMVHCNIQFFPFFVYIKL